MSECPIIGGFFFFIQVTTFALSSLLADPKARKVIVVEHPLLPLYIKEMIARILFENQVRNLQSTSLFPCQSSVIGSVGLFRFKSPFVITCNRPNNRSCRRQWPS